MRKELNMTYKTCTGIILMLGLLLIIGCSSKVSVTGKVTFEDGSPLEQGQVMMESAGYRVAGTIQQGGRFSLGELKDGDGVLPGEYDVWIVGTYVYPPPSEGHEREVPASMRYGSEENLVHSKFNMRSKSGLTCTVAKNGPIEYNITVSKP